MHDNITVKYTYTSEFINLRKTIGSGPAHGFV